MLTFWKRRHVFWVCVLVGWGALALFWTHEYGTHLLTQGEVSIRIAQNLYQHGVYSTGEVDAAGALLPTSRLPPMYPLVILASLALFGDTSIALEVVRLLLFGLAIGTVYFTYRIGCLWHERIGFIAATLAILDVHMLLVALNHDTPDFAVAFFVTVGIFYVLRYISGTHATADIVRSALCLGVAALTKVSAYLLWTPLFVVFLAFALWNRQIPIKQRVRHLGIFLAIILVFFGGWKVRNWYVVGTTSFTSQSGEVLLHYHAAQTLARAYGTPDAWQKYTAAFSQLRPTSSGAPLTQEFEDDYQRALGVRIILEHPISYLIVKLVDIPNLFLGTIPPYYFFPRAAVEDIVQKFEVGTFVGHRMLIPALWTDGRYLYVILYVTLKAFMLTLLLTAVFGVVCMIRDRDHRWLLIVLLTVIGYITFVSVPVADPRYRPPLMPMIYVLAAYGMYTLYARRARSVRVVAVV